MNREEIKSILPHRDDMLLLDAVERLPDGSARGTYTVRGDEFFLRGHFPDNPVVPGVILCEIIGQASCALVREAMGGKTPYYTGIDKTRFRGMVRPGDELTVTVRTLRQKANLYIVGGEARVGEKLCVSGEFSFMIV